MEQGAGRRRRRRGRKFDSRSRPHDNARTKAIQKQDGRAAAPRTTTAIAELETEKTASSRTQIAKLEQSIDKLRLGLPEVDQFAQPADGRITWVNQRYGTVWIDLGDRPTACGRR